MTQEINSESALSESGFKKNTALQLVLGISSLYIVFQIVVLVLMILSDAPRSMFHTHVIPYTGIWDFDTLLQRPYSLLTYTLCNREFLVLFANCIWIYVCGKSIEKKYGYMEVIPAYIFISILSAVIYTLLLKILNIQPEQYNIGAFTSLLGMSVSMVMGNFQSFKINENLKIPYVFIFIILLGFSFLQFSITSEQTWVLIISSYLTGVVYFLFVRKYSIGQKLYGFVQSTSKKFTPQFSEEDILGWDIEDLFKKIKEKHPMIAEEKLDEMFDKIRKNGFSSLSHIEKNIFYRLMND